MGREVGELVIRSSASATRAAVVVAASWWPPTLAGPAIPDSPAGTARLAGTELLVGTALLVGLVTPEWVRPSLSVATTRSLARLLALADDPEPARPTP
jgi:hypothetical protein